MLAKYLGERKDEFNVVGRVTGHLYRIEGPGVLVEVDLNDWPSFPRLFFEAVETVDPETITLDAEPLKRAATIDPSDGISDREAIVAQGALVQYRAEKLDKKLDKLAPIESQEWGDYYEAVSDEPD